MGNGRRADRQADELPRGQAPDTRTIPSGVDEHRVSVAFDVVPDTGALVGAPDQAAARTR